MHKKGIVVLFITVYLGQFFFVTFWRIESWPFSDYRIFEKTSHPQIVKVYSPYFELSDGSYISIIQEKIHVNKNHFHTANTKYKPSDHEKYIQKLIHSKEITQAISNMKKQNLFPVKFVVMQVSFRESKKHKWYPVHTPLKKYDLL